MPYRCAITLAPVETFLDHLSHCPLCDATHKSFFHISEMSFFSLFYKPPGEAAETERPAGPPDRDRTQQRPEAGARAARQEGSPRPAPRPGPAASPPARTALRPPASVEPRLQQQPLAGCIVRPPLAPAPASPRLAPAASRPARRPGRKEGRGLRDEPQRAQLPDGLALRGRPAPRRDGGHALREVQPGRAHPLHPRLQGHDHPPLARLRLRQLPAAGRRGACFGHHEF